MSTDAILAYYAHVDNNNIDKGLKIFDANIEYHRNDLSIKGLSGLKEFYISKRKLQGKHRITQIHNGTDVIIMQGVFEGNKKLQFADFFYFQNNKVHKRHSYIYLKPKS